MASLADILATVQQGVTAVNGLNSQLAKIGRPWTPYTPVVTSLGGSIVATSIGRFSQIGKTTFIEMTIFMSSGGAGTSGLVASLPTVSSSAVFYVLAGRENAVTGTMLQGITQGTSLVDIFTSNNGYPGGNGYQLIMSGLYESA